jgi:hypothetical protein
MPPTIGNGNGSIPKIDDQTAPAEGKEDDGQDTTASEDQQHDNQPRASDDEESEPPPANTDFVIRDGFPALRLPGTSKGWMIDGEEPIPRAKAWARNAALKFDHRELWERDCQAVFTAREKEQDEPYSAGVTYFCPALMKPRCALEALALSVFHMHCQHLETGVMIPEQSGAEWWTLVLDSDEKEGKARSGHVSDGDGEDDEEDEGDDVGLHFDADYGLEDQVPNLLLHPRLATVTYLTNHGAPTLVLDQRSPTPDEWHKNALHNRSIRTGWISHPRVGRHLAFDGRLLHGAPSTFFPPSRPLSNENFAAVATPVEAASRARDSPIEPPDNKRPKLDNSLPPSNEKRITILVNVWVNHCPLDAEPLDDAICDSLETPFSPLLPGATKAPGDETDANPEDEETTHPQSFTWVSSVDDLAAPPALRRVSLKTCPADPAGEEEFVLCNRLVTAKYGASMTALHDACRRGDDAVDDSDLVELDMEEGVVQLLVGGEVKHEDSDDEDNHSED